MISATALDAAIAAVPAKPKIMPDGVRRWIPAAVPQDAGPISDAFVNDLAENLNTEAVSIPIDGGAPGSVAHATAPESAVGWAHRAAVVDGQLFLEAEVLPAVAEAIDAGTLAYSSIDADYMRDDAGEYVPGSAHLITHALTNTPRNRGIAPMQAITAERRRLVHSYTRARLAEGESMSKKKDPTVPAALETPATVETVQASEPAAAEQEAPPAMTLEEAMAKIAELEAELAATKMAMEATAAEAVTETAEQKREAACVALVDRMIAEGRVTTHAREKWLASARADIGTAERLMQARPAMARRVVAAAEARGAVVTETASTYTEDETHLARMLRSGGLSEERVQATIARQRGKAV